MAASFLELFRVLTSFSPPRTQLKGAPWEPFVDWAIGQGLAPLAAYNLEYRLGDCGAPQWARDRLLSVYQGSLNDNVMKLVQLKRAVGELEGRRIALLSGAAYAEALYPHVAFRPVAEIRLLLAREDVDPFAAFLAQGEGSGWKLAPDLVDPAGSARALTDGRTQLLLHAATPPEVEALFRAQPVKVFGPSIYRLELEDAILATCLEQARAGYEVPMLTFIDLRELVLGAPSLAGPYSKTPAYEFVTKRAADGHLSRALYTSLGILERLFPETGDAVARLRPELRRPTRELLERLVIAPVSAVGELGETRTFKGTDRLRRLLAGAR